jgi:hypothetical protein
MKTIATVLATAALVSGIAIAKAQAPNPSQPPSQQTIDNNQGEERNPNGTVGGSKVNPSPNVGATTGSATRTAPASPGINPNPGELSGTPQINPNLNPAPRR